MVFGLLFENSSKKSKSPPNDTVNGSSNINSSSNTAHVHLTKEERLQEERRLQELLIAEQMKELELEHEFQQQTMMQKGLINHHKRQVEKKKIAESSGNTDSSTNDDADEGISSNNTSTKGKGPSHKLAKHIETARKGYEQLVHAIVRPPRASYKLNHLGPSSFTFCGKDFAREDMTLMTERGLNIECSHWLPVHPDNSPGSNVKTQSIDSVVVYMHGNASARVEVLQQLSYLLSLGTSVCSFDFAGSGMSDGDYVSLGYYEREDLASVVAHLRAKHGTSVRIALWGRSMGAATALMYASREATMPIQNVKCLIVDSSFCDLVQLAEEMVGKAREQGIVVPNLVVSVALAAIGVSVQTKAKFDIKDISPVQHAPRIDLPALFVCGEQDDFIKPHHSEKICEQYQGEKNLMIVQGDHNDPRPLSLFSAATEFLKKHLLEDKEAMGLNVPVGIDLQTAPWYFRGRKDIYEAHPTVKEQNKDKNETKSTSSVQDVDQSGIGMTKERQDAIQSSLITMLGSTKSSKESAETEEKTDTKISIGSDAKPKDSLNSEESEPIEGSEGQ